MPAYRFDPVFLASFLLCLVFERKWRTVHCWGGKQQCCQWLSSEVPFGVFHLFSPYKKRGNGYIRMLLISHAQIESEDREK